MTEFVAGQRVRYVGDVTPEAKGEEGTVIAQTHRDNVNVCWDNQRFNKGISGGYWGVLPGSIRIIDEIFKYDPKQAGDQDDDI